MKPVKLIPKKTPKGWRVNVPPHLSTTGKRQRLFFPSKDAAERDIAPLREKVRAGEVERLLPPEQARFAKRAFDVLAAFPPETIVEAAQEYVARHDLASRSRSFGEVWAAYVETAKQNHASERHLKNLARTAKRYAPLSERLICTITRDDLAGAITGASPSYKNSIIRETRAVFNFAAFHDWTTDNPAEKLPLSSRRLGEPEIYSPADCRKIMEACADTDIDLVPAFVAMLFAGVRPDHADGEITRLEWAHVLLSEKRIAIPGTITKTGSRRTIALRRNAEQWLLWYIAKRGVQTGNIAPERGTPLRARIRAVFASSGVKRIQDGLRKAFCSYVVPIDGLDVAERELGHAGRREVMNRHYRQDVTEETAREFWEILPKEPQQ